MLSANTIIPITSYDLSTGAVSKVYQIAVGAQPISLLQPSIGVSDNSSVIIVKDGLEDIVYGLENPATINYLASANTATSTGLSLLGSGVASTVAGVSTSGTSNITTPITYVTASGSNVKVTLPTISKLTVFRIINTSAVTISVFPKTGDYINDLAVNTAVTIAAGAELYFYTKADSVAATAKKGWRTL
jgi:hypothetical protein